MFVAFATRAHHWYIASRPSHYVVLRNDVGLPPTKYEGFSCHQSIYGTHNILYSIQAISFALCHVYAAATRSVSIPAPVYCEFQH